MLFTCELYGKLKALYTSSTLFHTTPIISDTSYHIWLLERLDSHDSDLPNYSYA